jgi:hypothetical protein
VSEEMSYEEAEEIRYLREEIIEERRSVGKRLALGKFLYTE